MPVAASLDAAAEWLCASLPADGASLGRCGPDVMMRLPVAEVVPGASEASLKMQLQTMALSPVQAGSKPVHMVVTAAVAHSHLRTPAVSPCAPACLRPAPCAAAAWRRSRSAAPAQERRGQPGGGGGGSKGQR